MATAVLKIGAPLSNVDRKSNQEFCNGLSANFPYKVYFLNYTLRQFIYP